MTNKIAELFDEYQTGVALLLSILIILLSLGLALGVYCFWGWIFMLVWNNLLPLLWTKAPTIGFWLATGIVFVIRLLFNHSVTVHNPH